MTTPSWFDEARCIPLWEGALVLRLDSGRCGGQFRLLNIVDNTTFDVRNSNDTFHFLEDIQEEERAVDLGDADTFSGAVRRLALKLGAPEEAVGEGVVFTPMPQALDAGTRWVLYAGGSCLASARSYHCFDSFPTQDPREALAMWWRRAM